MIPSENNPVEKEFEQCKRLGDAMDAFLDDFLKINFLVVLNKLKIIDYLNARRSASFKDLLRHSMIDSKGLEILLDVVIGFGAIEKKEGEYALTDLFRTAIADKELFDTRLNYSRLVLSDISINLEQMIANGDFLNKSIMGRFWKYPEANEKEEISMKRTRRWVDFISVFTKHDSIFCIKNHDFSKYRNILELGGNSGEFAIKMCENNDDLNVTILDLPEVVKIGEKNVSDKKMSEKIRFVAGDFFVDELPKGSDLIVFKSVLVDWDENKVGYLLKKCYDALEEGKKILIYEHEKIRLEEKGELEKNIISINFIRHFKDSKFYEIALEKSGFKKISVKKIPENEFMLITAEK